MRSNAPLWHGADDVPDSRHATASHCSRDVAGPHAYAGPRNVKAKPFGSPFDRRAKP
jgi:hypothetical protein